jgi:DNA-binding HxlR family transcriptional regulator
MMAKSGRRPRSGCPIGLALDIFGDSWSLLIVRDMMFKGKETFDAFEKAGEGIATNILAERLSRLEGAGILHKRRSRDDARRFVYRLTKKGIELAPVLTELILWSARHEKTDAPPSVIARMAANPAAFARRIVADWKKITDHPGGP